jgi:hypothetical protein
MRAAVVTTAVIAGALLVAGSLWAAEDRPGRYTMTPTDGGILKLDTVTGAVSLCTRGAAGAAGDWACQPTKDGEQTLRREIDGLKGEIQVLKEQLTRTEELAGIGDPSKSDGPRPGTQTDGPRPGGTGPQAKVQLPTEKDIDQAFDYFEGMVKKLRERMNKLEGDEKKKGTPL